MFVISSNGFFCYDMVSKNKLNGYGIEWFYTYKWADIEDLVYLKIRVPYDFILIKEENYDN